MQLLSPVLHFGIIHLPILISGGVLLVALQLVERRGRGRDLDPRRQVDLGTLYESIPDPVFLFDNRGTLVDLNRLAEALCGRIREQLLGTTIAGLNELLAARDEFDRPVEAPSMGVNRALHGETVRNLRRVFRHPSDGHVLETLTSASPIRDAKRAIHGALLIVRDVTEIAQLQRRLADTQRHKEVGQMAAGLAHDFSNVLDSIAQAAMLVDDTEGQRAQERQQYTEMIRGAVARGSEIVDRVREYLRTGTGSQSEVDLRQVLRDALDLTRPLWQGRTNLKISSELQAVPGILANAADLRRAFTNLIINALEAMPGGGELSVRCEPAGSGLRAIVSDTGNGMTAEQQKHIFAPYFTTKPQGTGLGLSGARRIVDSLHGHIGFWSKESEGTTFVVELPAAPLNQVSPSNAGLQSRAA